MSQTEETTTEPKAFIKLKVYGRDSGDNPEIHYRIEMSAELGKLKTRYSERAGVGMTTLRFLYDGRRIYDEETPRMHGMQNDDVIEVYNELAGDTGYLD